MLDKFRSRASAWSEDDSIAAEFSERVKVKTDSRFTDEQSGLLLLQTPKSNCPPLPHLSSRGDVLSMPIGSRVFVLLSFKKNRNALVRDTSNRKIQMLTAKGYIYQSCELKPAKLSISSFEDIRELRKQIEHSYHTAQPLAVSGTLTTYNDIYQLEKVSIHQNSDNSEIKVYQSYLGLPHYVTARYTQELALKEDVVTHAVTQLYKALKIETDEQFSRLTTNLDMRFQCARELITCVHLGAMDNGTKKNSRVAKSQLEQLATITIIKQSNTPEPHQERITPLDLSIEILGKGIQSLDISPSDEQKRMALNILKSFRSEVTTRHLIYGDVGYGKTCVAAMIIYHLCSSGFSSIMMCPAEHLAIQTYDVLNRWFPSLREQIKLVTHNTDIALNDDCPGTCYVGTSALLHRDTENHAPFAVFVDEEQRFGTSQREYFNQAKGAHYIAMTATPIPRTVAGTVLAHYQTHILSRCFVDKSFKGNLYMGQHGRVALFDELKESLQNSRQVLFVCPLTVDSDKDGQSELSSVETLHHKLTERFGPVFRFVHSKRKMGDNIQALDDIRDFKAKGLVASTAIEVGIDLPHLQHIIILNPERFGLTQLHQLRGRVARRGGVGLVSLFSPTLLTQPQIDRLEYFVNESDGTKVAEYDAQRRGVGDLTGPGRAQSGQLQSTFIKHLTVDYAVLKSLYEAMPSAM